jgi:predicted rRNA methylase YqxC with S4 and FtsJ domains
MKKQRKDTIEEAEEGHGKRDRGEVKQRKDKRGIAENVEKKLHKRGWFARETEQRHCKGERGEVS